MAPLTTRQRLALTALACCLLAGVAIWVAIWRLRVAWTERQLAFVASASGLPLPEHPRDIESHDNGQFAIVVAVELSQLERDAILRTGKLHLAAHGETPVRPQRPSDFHASDRLPAAFRDIRETSEVYHGGGCSPRQSWTALLDKSSNRIWVEVLYPDWGGDGPGCSFPPMDAVSRMLEEAQAP